MALTSYALSKMSQHPGFADARFAGDLDEAMLVACFLKIGQRAETGEIHATDRGPDLHECVARHFR